MQSSGDDLIEVSSLETRNIETETRGEKILYLRNSELPSLKVYPQSFK